MPQVTITAKTGAGAQVTAQVFTDVSAISLDFDRKVIQIYTGDAQLTGPAKEFDMTGVTTVTDTITAGNHVLVIS